MKVASVSLAGRRKSNQDSVLSLKDSATGAFVLAVADGVGGVAGGEYASRIAGEEARKSFHSHRFKHDEFSEDEARRLALEIFANSASRIAKYRDKHPELRKMATTLTVAIGVCKRFLVAHIGDSGALLLENAATTFLSEPHSYLGEDSHSQPTYLNPKPGLLLRYLPQDSVPEFYPKPGGSFTASEGARLLLFTDGILPHRLPEEVVRHSSSLRTCIAPKAFAGRLARAAIELGSQDNVSAAVAQWKGRALCSWLNRAWIAGAVLVTLLMFAWWPCPNGDKKPQLYIAACSHSRNPALSSLVWGGPGVIGSSDSTANEPELRFYYDDSLQFKHPLAISSARSRGGVFLGELPWGRFKGGNIDSASLWYWRGSEDSLLIAADSDFLLPRSWPTEAADPEPSSGLHNAIDGFYAAYSNLDFDAASTALRLELVRGHGSKQGDYYSGMECLADAYFHRLRHMEAVPVLHQLALVGTSPDDWLIKLKALNTIQFALPILRFPQEATSPTETDTGVQAPSLPKLLDQVLDTRIKATFAWPRDGCTRSYVDSLVQTGYARFEGMTSVLRKSMESEPFSLPLLLFSNTSPVEFLLILQTNEKISGFVLEFDDLDNTTRRLSVQSLDAFLEAMQGQGAGSMARYWTQSQEEMGRPFPSWPSEDLAALFAGTPLSGLQLESKNGELLDLLNPEGVAGRASEVLEAEDSPGAEDQEARGEIQEPTMGRILALSFPMFSAGQVESFYHWEFMFPKSPTYRLSVYE